MKFKFLRKCINNLKYNKGNQSLSSFEIPIIVKNKQQALNTHRNTMTNKIVSKSLSATWSENVCNNDAKGPKNEIQSDPQIEWKRRRVRLRKLLKHVWTYLKLQSQNHSQKELRPTSKFNCQSTYPGWLSQPWNLSSHRCRLGKIYNV